MRCVAVADTHFNVDPDMVPDGDVLFHGGDLMYNGTPDEWAIRVAWLAAMPHKTKILVPGNHDFHFENYQGVAIAEMRRAGVKVLGLRDQTMILKGKKILGLPWVPNLPGWAFNRLEISIEQELKQFTDYGADLVISHSPPFNILDAMRPEQTVHRNQEHVGCLAYNQWFYALPTNKRPKVWMCGHIHESYGRTNIEGTEFINAAMCDRNYDQTNAPIVFDL